MTAPNNGELARRILERQLWRLHLTPNEGALFEQVAKSSESWSFFEKDPLNCLAQPEFAGFTCLSTQTDDERPKQCTPAVAVTLRIHVMLSEYMLSNLSGLAPPYVALGTRLLDTDANNTYENMAVDSNNKPDVIEPHQEAVPSIDISQVVPIDDMFHTLELDAGLLADIVSTRNPSDAANNLAGRGYSRIGINDTSRNNTTGSVGIDSIQDIQNSLRDRRISMSESNNPNGSQSHMQPKRDANEVHASLKHMFKIIRESAEPGQLKALKKLLVEVRPSRSKWANEDRIGQEALYEALEKVLNDLKNFTDHSLPFLKPVQKREAPNYYDIIKNPMDLGTMSKKLKSLQYNSKEEFARDLNLIWTNCFTYNTIPDSIYRRHASAMKRKAGELLKRVPDIQIKNIAAEESDSDDETDVKAENRDAQMTPSVAADTPNYQPQTHHDMIKMELDPTNDGAASMQNEPRDTQFTTYNPSSVGSPSLASMAGSVDARKNSDSSNTVPAPDPAPQTQQPASDDKDDDENQQEHDEPDVDDDDSAYNTLWNQASLQSRKQALKKREDQLILPFPDRAACIRTSDAMAAYISARNRSLKQERKRNNLISLMKHSVLNVDTSLLEKACEKQALDNANKIKQEKAPPVSSSPQPGHAKVPEQNADEDCAENQPKTENLEPNHVDKPAEGEDAAKATASAGSDAPAQPAPSDEQTESVSKPAANENEGVKTDNTQLAIARAYSNSFLPEIQYPWACVPDLYSPSSTMSLDLHRFLNEDPPFVDIDEAGNIIDPFHVPPAPPPTLSEYPEMMPNPRSALYVQMLASVHDFHQIRTVYGKIMAMQNQSGDASVSASGPSSGGLTVAAASSSSSAVGGMAGIGAHVFLSEAYKPMRPRDALPPLCIRPESVRAVMRRTCAFILTHSGFEATTDNTLSALTEVALDYFTTLGRTLQAYHDRFASIMSCEEIMLAVLELNGVQDPTQLETYIRHDIVRSGSRLRDLRRKLHGAYIDLERTMRASNGQDGVMEEDVELEESRDQIISGNFYQEMGVDFLGLRDVGIDITSIPVELWNRNAERPIRARVKRSILAANADENAATARGPAGSRESAMPQLPEWPPIDPQQQILLLKPFYDKKGMTVEELATDESRPRTKEEKQILKLAQQGRKRAATSGASGGVTPSVGGGAAHGEPSSKRKRKTPTPATGATNSQSASAPSNSLGLTHTETNVKGKSGSGGAKKFAVGNESPASTTAKSGRETPSRSGSRKSGGSRKSRKSTLASALPSSDAGESPA